MGFIKSKLSDVVRRLLAEQEGAAASEYVLILGLIVVIAIGVVAVFGLHVSETTSAVYTGISGGTDSNGATFGPGSFRSHTNALIP